MMPVALCIHFPFATSCDDILTMLVCATRWLSMHLTRLLTCSCMILLTSVLSMLQRNEAIDI